MDADFSHDPTALPTLLEAAEEYDVVIGSRYVPGAAIPNWTLARLASRAAATSTPRGCSRSASRTRPPATASTGARALERMDYATVRGEGYAFQIEMTHRARTAGATIREVPITFIDRVQGTSKMSSAIVVEALLLVTGWALERPLQALRAWFAR